MMKELFTYNQIFMQAQGVAIPSTTIVLDLPGYFGVFNRGIFSGVGFFLWLFLIFLFLLWVGLIIYAAFRMIVSQYEPQAFQTGAAFIKNALIGVTYAVVFFSLVSIGMIFFGLGAPWNWAENLAQCPADSPAPRRFYFQGLPVRNAATGDIDENIPYSEQIKDYQGIHALNIYCCETPEGDPAVIVGRQMGECVVAETISTANGGNTGSSCVGNGSPCSDASGTINRCCQSGLSCYDLDSSDASLVKTCNPI